MFSSSACPVIPLEACRCIRGIGGGRFREVGESAGVDTPQVSRLLEVLIGDMSRAEIMSAFALKDRMHFAKKAQAPIFIS